MGMRLASEKQFLVYCLFRSADVTGACFPNLADIYTARNVYSSHPFYPALVRQSCGL